MSRQLTVEVPHSLPLDEALARIRALGEYFVNRHGMSMRWESDTVGHLVGRYLVVHIDGRFAVTEDKVRLEGKDPGMLLRRKAVDYLSRKIRSYLDPSVPIAELERG